VIEHIACTYNAYKVARAYKVAHTRSRIQGRAYKVVHTRSRKQGRAYKVAHTGRAQVAQVVCAGI
jgi:hypothetical protein